MAGASEAFVLAPGEGRSIDLGAFGMTVKAGWDETDGVFSLLEAEEPPGFGPPVHIHHDAAEAFYVLEASTSCSWTTARSRARQARSFSSRPECATASGAARRRVAN